MSILNRRNINNIYNNDNILEDDFDDEFMDDDDDIMSEDTIYTNNDTDNDDTDSLNIDNEINENSKKKNEIEDELIDEENNFKIINSDIPELIIKINKFTDYLKKRNNNLLEKYNQKYFEREKELNKIFIKKEIYLKNEYKKKLEELNKKENNFILKKLEWEKLNNYNYTKNEEDEIININIGGIIYTTKIGTLISEKYSYFNKIFKNKDNIKKDKEGNYFIDRDGETFRYILNWLRDKTSTHFPRKRSEIYSLLKNDVKFYNLKKLERILNFSPHRFEKEDYVICEDNKELFKYIICVYNHENNKEYKHVSNYWTSINNELKFIEINSYEDQIRKYDLEYDMYFSDEETCGEYFNYIIKDTDKYRDYIQNIEVLKNDCSICLKKLEINQWIHKTRCNHLFHISCLNKWILKNSDPNCPLCRKKIFKVF